MLLLMLPVTVAACDRSFSKLKWIKNFLQSTMSQEHLSDLAVLPTENHRAKQLDTSGIVDAFTLHKRRYENGSLTNDFDVGVQSVANWTWMTTLLNSTIQCVIWLAVRPKPSHMMAVFCTCSYYYYGPTSMLLYADAGRP